PARDLDHQAQMTADQIVQRRLILVVVPDAYELALLLGREVGKAQGLRAQGGKGRVTLSNRGQGCHTGGADRLRHALNDIPELRPARFAWCARSTRQTSNALAVIDRFRSVARHRTYFPRLMEPS